LGAGRRDLELEGDTEFPWFRWNWELEEGVRRMDPTPGSVWLRLCGGQTGREGNGSFEGVLGSQRRQYLCRSEMRPTGEGNPKVNGMGEEEEYQTCRRSRKLQILLGPTDTHTHTHTLSRYSCTRQKAGKLGRTLGEKSPVHQPWTAPRPEQHTEG
jgi:hypothetical protein